MRQARIKKEGKAKGKIVNVGTSRGRLYYCYFGNNPKAYQFWKNDLEFLD